MREKYEESHISIPSYISDLESPMRKKHQDKLIGKQAKVIQTDENDSWYVVVHWNCFKDKADKEYNAWEEDIAVVNIFFGEETVMGGID